MFKKLYSPHRKNIFPTLSTIGFAVQYFPCYINTGKNITHGHDILEANYIIKGTGFQVIGKEEKKCSAGSLGIVHYGQEHCLFTDANGVETINIYLDPAKHSLPTLNEDLSAIIGSLFPPAPLLGMPRGLVYFIDFRNPEPISSLLKYCCAEQEKRNSSYESVLESILKIFLINCAREAQSEGINTLVADHSRWGGMEKIRMKLENEFTENHTLAELADSVNISEGHLCRQFKLYTSLSPFEYLVKRRIQAAMQMLRNSDLKIMAIAFNAGFQDLGYFNKKFKQLCGCSPREYRKRFQK